MNSTTTQLLTLLNVSATKLVGRKRNYEEAFTPSAKLNKRKTVALTSTPVENAGTAPKEDPSSPHQDIPEDPLDDLEEVNSSNDLYNQHFGSHPVVLTEKTRASADAKAWKQTKTKHGKLGMTVCLVPDGSELVIDTLPRPDITPKLRTSLKEAQAKKEKGQTQLQNDLLSALATRCDLYIPTLNLQAKPRLRETIAINALNHVYKKRTRVLKNNERLVNAAKSDAPTEPMEDQGFTRPSVLILLPFRSFALDWFHALVTHASGPKVQIENQARFLSEYGLPPGAEDKLASAPPGTYAEDHVEVLKGNTDDNFRVGIKITKKSMKMFADFYGCDIIMASPLGLRRSIEKEKHADYLSSIEVLVVDQLDVLAMQNWDHLKFIISHLNEMPKDDHDVDFSRIKPWYLDGNSRYLRQSILLSPYETPDTRALFNNLHNVSGKIRTERRWSPLEVPDGVLQDFIKFDCSNPMSEADKRFEYFSTQLFPSILKSAVQSVQTAVFIPSSFDFVRVHNFFKKSGTSFSVLSEYSSNQDISRARQAFFSGKTAFLLVTERFHFYRRYNIRGIRNLVFYGPPDHAQYYAEYLSYPFLDTGVDVADVSCRCLYSKYDWFALERIAGTIGAKELLSAV